MKRGAGTQITKDGREDEDDYVPEQLGKATAEEMATRVIYKAKRRNPVAEPTATGDASLAGAANTAVAGAAAPEAPGSPKQGGHPLAQFRRKEDEWTCSACDLNNPGTTSVCRACETPRDPAAAAAAAAAPAPAPASSSGPTFSFGTPAAGSSFAFGSAPPAGGAGVAPAAGGAGAGGGFKFGSVGAEPAFKFGGTGTSLSFPGGASTGGGFTFGGPVTAASFTFGGLAGTGGAAPSPAAAAEPAATSSPADAASGDGAESGSFAAKFGGSPSSSVLRQGSSQPKLVGEKEASGEEDEQILHSVMAKVYRLETDEQTKAEKWNEHGKGSLHVNVWKDAKSGKGSARLVMRTEKTERVVLNAPLLPGAKAVVQNEKFIKTLEVDPANLSGPSKYVLLRFAGKAEAEACLGAIEKAVSSLGS